MSARRRYGGTMVVAPKRVVSTMRRLLFGLEVPHLRIVEQGVVGKKAPWPFALQRKSGWVWRTVNQGSTRGHLLRFSAEMNALHRTSFGKTWGTFPVPNRKAA